MADALTYPEWDIKICAVAGGLRVSQHGRAYLARKWRLTPEIRSVVETALEFGLGHLWQQGHPSKDESHHISFSFSHDPNSWVFVIGNEAGPPALRFVTFHKRFKAYFNDSGFGWAWDWENAGGKNILVHPDHLRPILERLPLQEIKAGLLPIYDPGWVLNLAKSYIRSEAQLEEALYAAFIKHATTKRLDRQRSFQSSAADQRAARPDLILDLTDKIVVTELKVGNCPEADVAQVCRYLLNVALLKAYSGKPLFGALVGSDFQADAVAEARRSSISLYAYDEADGIQWRLVEGRDVLPKTGGSA